MNKWEKRDCCNTLSEVIERNTGMSIADLDKVYNTPIKGLKDVASHLKRLAAEEKSVTVFADYDCDGICSAVIMNAILHSLGIKFNIMFPKRSTGYGLQPHDVEKIESDVIITIDNGIAAFEGVNAAKEKGIEVIIIDHHLQSVEGVPNADYIIDPHVFKDEEDYFEDWCGAGLGYELSRLLCDESSQMACLQFAAIATVADVVPLLKDNRKIVKEGLTLINKTKVPSLRNFIASINKGSYSLPVVDETTIGFKFGPIINAMGRIEDNAQYVYKYFISGDQEMLDHMIEVNERRKELVTQSFERACEIITEECLFGDVPIIVHDPQTVSGIVGVVAGRLAETYNTPVICLTDDENDPEIVHGSARSTDDINIKEALDKVSDLLEKYGGHAGAAGISLRKENIDNLRMRFSDVFVEIPDKKEMNLEYDLEITADQIGEFMTELKRFGPYGEGNPNPSVLVKDFKLFPRAGKFYTLIGSDANTVKFFGNNSSAIGFDMAQKYKDIGVPKILNVVGKISENHYGKPEPQIEMQDFDSAGKSEEKSDLAKSLAEKLNFDF